MVALWVALGCGGEPEPGAVPIVPAPEAPALPVATVPAELAAEQLDARPAAYTHPQAGACVDCHAEQAQAWQGSHHDRALDAATAALGAFDGVPVRAGPLVVTPGRRGEDRVMTVVDAAGERTWTVRHTFGVDPLQQLLLEGDDGALIVAPIAWDSAGTRWFDPAPDGAVGDPADPLYWAGLFGTWNHMCSSCHSTGVVEGHDPGSGLYATTWTHEDVACQACHGEGPTVQTLARGEDQVDTCAACHSLRSPLAPGWIPGAPLLDHFTPALLDNPVYATDGGLQPDQEAFVWGSFQQSAMAAAGVRCTHCHDPHTAELVAEGDGVCTQCHDPRYDTEPHDSGGTCVSCHLTEQRYMGVDLRADHRFAVPGQERGLPAALVARARQGDPQTQGALLAAAGDTALAPFHRASALALLERQRPSQRLGPVLVAADDPSDLVRWRAIQLLAAWGQAGGLWGALDDPVAAVRFAAAKGLLQTGSQPPDEAAGARLSEVTTELRTALAAEADEPASHLNLAVILALEGDLDGAIAAARIAVAQAPAFGAAQQMLQALEAQRGP